MILGVRIIWRIFARFIADVAAFVHGPNIELVGAIKRHLERRAMGRRRQMNPVVARIVIIVVRHNVRICRNEVGRHARTLVALHEGNAVICDTVACIGQRNGGHVLARVCTSDNRVLGVIEGNDVSLEGR